MLFILIFSLKTPEVHATFYEDMFAAEYITQEEESVVLTTISEKEFFLAILFTALGLFLKARGKNWKYVFLFFSHCIAIAFLFFVPPPFYQEGIGLLCGCQWEELSLYTGLFFFSIFLFIAFWREKSWVFPFDGIFFSLLIIPYFSAIRPENGILTIFCIALMVPAAILSFDLWRRKGMKK